MITQLHKKLYNVKYIAVVFVLLFYSGKTTAQDQMGSLDFAMPSQTFNEANPDTDCNAFRTYDISVFGIQVEPAVSVTILVNGGTAAANEDFELSNSTFDVEGTGAVDFQIDIFNDALIEGDETIELLFSFNGEPKNAVITIKDDDVAPIVGNTTQDLLVETFDASTLPDAWETVDAIDTGLNHWEFNGSGLAAGTAYITDGVAGMPTYDGNLGTNPLAMDASSNALLLTPMISAAGLKDVNITFDWAAGGELDTESPSPFDFGQLSYKIEGEDFVVLENFTGTPESLGAVVQSGTFSQLLPELANKNFQVGFRWINDQLIGTAFSFTVDNVSVTAEPLSVETSETGSDIELVRTQNDVYFVSDQNTAIMARIENATEDLGCVQISVIESGTAAIENSQAGFNRASKVFQITADGTNASSASYDLTLYYASDELSVFTNISTMNMVKVEGADIDATTDTNTTVTGQLFEDNSASGYVTFKGNFSGFGVFSVVENATQSIEDIASTKFSVFPTVLAQQEQLHIVSNNTSQIESVIVYDVTGKRVYEMNNNSVSKTSFSLNVSAGLYFLKINNATETTKFIVK
jgi:hypothetical protein